MKCQACLALYDIDCILVSTTTHKSVFMSAYAKEDIKVESDQVYLSRSYYCPRCKARFIVEEVLNVYPKA